jgi:NTP pyrophosphatase (non-canonical NTP hydrolase)
MRQAPDDFSNISFVDLMLANFKRLPQFKTKNGDIAHKKPDGSDWSIAEWTNAMAGEVGEACNVAKKIRRGDYDGDIELARRLLLSEIADVVIYADLICQQLNASLGDAVRQTFNEKSLKLRIDVQISSRAERVSEFLGGK